MRIASEEDPRDLDEVAQPTISELNLIDREPHVRPFERGLSRIIPETTDEGNRTPVECGARTRYSYGMTNRVQQEEGSKKLLQWVQQQAGLSRRKALELIEAGEVSVNGRSATEPSARFRYEDLESLSLRGHPLPIEEPERRIYKYHKPRDVLCSHDDPHDGNTVGRILRAEGFIGYTWAGRLDRDAEGLLVLSNDGDLVHAYTHPRFEVAKVYRVWTDPSPRPAEMKRAFASMIRGITDAGDQLRILDGRIAGRPPYAEVTLAEGRKHEVKRLFAHFGLRIVRLLRIRMGDVALGNLQRGTFARLSTQEETAIFASVESRLARL